mgnify:CR=1 FL=1
MGRLLDEQTLVKIIDNHLNDKNQLDDDITCILEEVPTVEAVPMVHLDVEKSEILDTLDKMQFFLGQRAGRELWNDKPEDIQEKDLENFNRDIQKIKEYLFNVKPVERGEWKEYSYNQYMGLDDLGEPKFRESIGYRCTKCDLNSIIKHSFCPRCGRDMRKMV